MLVCDVQTNESLKFLVICNLKANLPVLKKTSGIQNNQDYEVFKFIFPNILG